MSDKKVEEEKQPQAAVTPPPKSKTEVHRHDDKSRPSHSASMIPEEEDELSKSHSLKVEQEN